MAPASPSVIGDLDDLAGLPCPLGFQRLTPARPRLAPPASGRRAWILLAGEHGYLDLIIDGEAKRLGAEDALLLAVSPGPALQPAAEADWAALAFCFCGFDDLVESILLAGTDLRLPASCWARRQLSSLERTGLSDLGLASAMRLVAGIVANLIEHNFESRSGTGESALVDELIRLLDAVIEDPDAQLGHIADAVGISLSHMGRLFRRHLGTTPSRYLQDRRMRRAGELLRQLDLDIGAIATRLGYTSASAFGAAFRSVTGQSPSAYRASRSVPIWEHGA